MTDYLNETSELIKRTITKWQEDKVSRLAAALAFFAVLSIPSILILTITIAGQIVGEQDAQQTVISQAGQVMGSEGQAAIRSILKAATSRLEGFTPATILSVVVFLFGASGVFVQLQDAMNKIYAVEPDNEQGLVIIVQKRIISFLIVIGLGLLLGALLFVNSLVILLGETLSDLLPGPIAWVRILNFMLSFFLLTGLIALIFKMLPDADVAWHDVGVGALVTAGLFIAGIFAFGLYLEYGNPASGYGAAGSLIVLLLWVYYSAQMLFLGAEFTQTYANLHGTQILPKEGARWAGAPPREVEQVEYYERER